MTAPTVVLGEEGEVKVWSKVYEILKRPFPSKDIQWRIGRKNKNGDKAIVLAYVDARAIQERLDEAFDTWKTEYTPVDMGTMEIDTRNGTETKHVKGFLCEIIGCKDSWVMSRQDGGDCTDFEPFKGGLSSAFKRAGAALGIGRYLYDLGETWVEIDKYGNFDPPQLPDWALPEEERGKAKPAKRTVKTTTANTVSEAKPAVDMSEHKCAECGADVTTPVATFSQKKFNKVLCFNCQRKEKV